MKNKQSTRANGFVLVQDESGDWYVIPQERRADWSELMCDEDCHDIPKWALGVYSLPESVVFRDFVIEQTEPTTNES